MPREDALGRPPLLALRLFWQLLFAGPPQHGDFAQRKFTIRSGLHVQRERAVAYPLDLLYVVANLFKHPADLPVLALDQRDFIPRIVAFSREPHLGWSGTLRVHGAVTWLGREFDAVAQLLNIFLFGLARNFDQICFRHVRSSAHQMVGQCAVIGHEQQAFTEVIEAAYGINARSRLLHQFHHRGAAFRIGNCGDVALGLVQKKIDVALDALQQLAVNFDVVAFQVRFTAQFGDDLPVDGDAPLGNQFFCMATGRDAGRGDDLLQALSRHLTSGTF